MTALEGYVRFEATGLWRERRDVAPREVIVSFGNATLMLKDLADAPLGHWALAGVTVLDRDAEGTTYAMSPDGGETLTIRDRDMIAAIAAVTRGGRTAPQTGRPRRRRRLPLTPLFVLALLGGVAWAAPRVIHPDPALLVPPDRAAEVGDRMAIALVARHGAACVAPAGIEALSRLAARLSPEAPLRLKLMALGDGVPAAILPGGTVLLDRTLAAAPAEVLAGWAALAMGRVPAASLLRAAGPVDALRFLATGVFTEAAVERAAGAALVAPAAAEAAPALARLAAARIDPAPFAAALAAAGLPAPTPATAPDPLPIASHDRAALRAVCNGG